MASRNPTNDLPVPQPIDGNYVDDEGEDQWEMWVFIPDWEVASESKDGVTLRPRHD